MGRPAEAGEFSGCDVQRSEQGRGTVADIVMSAILRNVDLHRQQGCGPIERLDLRVCGAAPARGHGDAEGRFERSDPCAPGSGYGVDLPEGDPVGCGSGDDAEQHTGLLLGVAALHVLDAGDLGALHTRVCRDEPAHHYGCPDQERLVRRGVRGPAPGAVGHQYRDARTVAHGSTSMVIKDVIRSAAAKDMTWQWVTDASVTLGTSRAAA